jgi:hypothetical protein
VDVSYDDQIAELMRLFPGAQRHEEGGYTFFFLPSVPLPETCSPRRVDMPLCPMPRDGYPSHLYFAERIAVPTALNWNNQARILERNWHAFSLQVTEPDLRLAQMVKAHVRALGV